MAVASMDCRFGLMNFVFADFGDGLVSVQDGGEGRERDKE